MNKPIVHYKSPAIKNGIDRALLYPVDHPNHLDGHNISNNKQVLTSKIISWDEITGRIETQNTIYIPEE